MAVEPRPAASVVLVRPGTTSALECYLIQRARSMRFLGGYFAFPGGKVDLADRTEEALARARGLDPDRAAAALGDPVDSVPPLAYWIAAVRELFEETGLLWVVDETGRAPGLDRAGVTERLERHRRALVRGERSFPAILAEEEWYADLTPLAHLALFVTPPTSPIRFAARFFLCPLPPGQGPRVILEEIAGGHWVSPELAYGRFRAREWPMAEPAEYTARYLAQFDSYEAVWAHHADGQAKFHGTIDRIEVSRDELFDGPGATPARR